MTQLLSISVDSVRESSLNPRKSFDESKLNELCESIKAHGLLQPIVVRTLAKSGKGQSHEIVCGARRFRAARLAGLKEIPAVVRDLDDEQAFEAMVVENLQRADIDPLDEADGFKALQARGLSLADIGAKVGKGERFVFTRLRLCTLTKKGRKLLQDDVLPIQHAYQIAQLEPKDQDELLSDYEGWNRPKTLQDLSSRIGSSYTRRIKDATFDTAADNLLPQVVACLNCPKNTSFNPNLFAGTKDDGHGLCTDRTCWNAKSRLAGEALLAKVLADKPDIQKLSMKWNSPAKGTLSRSRWNEAWQKNQPHTLGVVADSDNPAEIGKIIKVAIEASGSGKDVVDPEAELEKKRARKEELRTLRVENLTRRRVFDLCLAVLVPDQNRLLSGALAKAVVAKLVVHVTQSNFGAPHKPDSTQDLKKALGVKSGWPDHKDTPTAKSVKTKIADPGTADFERELLTAICYDEIAVHDYHRPSGFALFAAAEALGVDVDHIRKEADYELMSKKQKAEFDKGKGGS